MGLIFDKWSVIHVVVAAILTIWFGAYWAFALMIVWEVFEWAGAKAGWEKYIPGFWAEPKRNRWFGDIISNLVGIGLALLFFV